MSYVKNSISLLLTVVLLSGCGSSGDSKSKNTIVPDNPNFNVVTVDQINQAMERVVAWQKSNWSESFVQPEKDNAQFGTRNWVVASAVPGLLSAAHRLEDQDLKSRLNDLAVKNGWELGSGRYLADDHLIGRLYLHLYQETEELYRIAHIQETFDYIIANPQTSSLYFPTEDEVAEGIPRCIYRWCWSDALYMSPANWHLLTKITGLTKYADFADREFWISARYLYDESASLFYRDSTFFDLQEVKVTVGCLPG